MNIIFTVTNDLTYDQRMQRICSSLAAHGYKVQLVGRELPQSLPLALRPFSQKRLRCRFHRGFTFYAEYNLRLFFYLLTARYDAVCSIDLDTLAAGCVVTLIRRKKRVFDAHEYFTEVPEVVHRPLVKAFWAGVARCCLPFYQHAYTVGPALAGIFKEKYGLDFAVVRNMPLAPPSPTVKGASGIEENVTNQILPKPDAQVLSASESSPPVKGGLGGANSILYQGALNAGRGLEAAIIAMQQIENVELWIVGEGDLSAELRELAAQVGVQDKVHFLGFIKPDDLKALTSQAWVGLNLLENSGLSYYYSLANKFFDYVQAEVPVITMNFPEYSALNKQQEVALLLRDLLPDTVASAIRRLQDDPTLFARLRFNCLQARQIWNWEADEKVLLEVWERV